MVTAVEERIAPSAAIDLTRNRCTSPEGATQEDFVFDRRRYVSWIGGRGCSKSASGTFKTMDYFSNWEGARMVIIAPSYPQLQGGLMQTFFKHWPDSWILKRNMSQDKMWVEVLPYFPEDYRIPRLAGQQHKVPGRIYFRNAQNPDSLRSYEFAVLWLDEARDIREEVASVAQACQRQIRPPETIYPDDPIQSPFYPYQTFITTTPAGTDWVNRRYIQGDPKRVGVYRARSHDNVFLPQTFLNDLDEDYGVGSIWHRQEVLGEIVEFQGLVFPKFSRDKHVRPLPVGTKFKDVVGGVDFGNVDPMVAILIGTDESGRRWVFKEFYQKRPKFAAFVSLLAEWQREYNVTRYFCDPHEPTIISTLNSFDIRAVKGYSRSIETRVQMINHLLDDTPGGPGIRFVDGEIIEGVREMLTYRHEEGIKEGSFSDSIKKKQMDHFIDAFGMAVMGGLTKRQPHNIIGFRFGAR